MANRVTEAEVLEILPAGTSLVEATVLPFATSANTFVTANLGDKSLSDDLLKEIERWIAAHMIAMSKEQQIKEAGAGGAVVKYTGYWSYKLLATNYGQVAVSLDTSKTLEAIAKGKLAAWSVAVPGA